MKTCLPRNIRGTVALVAGLGLAAGASAVAGQPLVSTESAESLQKGKAEGVAITAKGQLFLAPRLVRQGPPGAAEESVHVWDMVADARGSIYLGTGPDGRVLRVGPTGRHTTFYRVDEPMVTALALLPNDDLLVATAPGGRIYRVDADGNGRLWCETEERYVWSLAKAADGSIHAGTGESGKVLEISDGGRSRVLFDSDEIHIMSLLALPGGGLLAGGAGRGLVYRIDPEGNALVLYNDPLTEVSALALEDDGSVLAALVAPAARESRSPAVRIRLPDASPAAPGDGMADFDDGAGPTLSGVIEGLPRTEQRAGSATRGRLVRIEASGNSTTLWRSTDEVPFGLVVSGGRVFFGTGQPARLYRLEPGDDPALLATLQEAQTTGLLSEGRSVALATSNPAALYHVVGDIEKSGVFLSRPFDAGGPARWGSLRWRTTGALDGAELYTRTGNSATPDGTWSAWSPALTTPSRSAIVNPDGRYLQWRVRFAGAHGDTVRVSSVTLHYEPYNRPPRLREFYVEAPHPAVSDTATLRWATYDPDDDPVEVAIEYRPIGSDAWRRITGAHDESARPDGAPGVDWRDDRVVLDTQSLAEGDYEFRAVIDDQAGNDPDDGHAVVGDDNLFLTVDQTPPEINLANSPGGAIELTVSDAFSDVRSLEVRADGRLRFTLRPVDGVCDSRREIFRFELPATADGKEAVWSVRAIDSAGNKVEAPLAAPR